MLEERFEVAHIPANDPRVRADVYPGLYDIDYQCSGPFSASSTKTSIRAVFIWRLEGSVANTMGTCK